MSQRRLSSFLFATADGGRKTVHTFYAMDAKTAAKYARDWAEGQGLTLLPMAEAGLAPAPQDEPEPRPQPHP